MSTKTRTTRRRGKRSVAIMKTLPPDVLRHITTFIGETKFRFLAKVRHSWSSECVARRIESLWLNIEWASPSNHHDHDPDSCNSIFAEHFRVNNYIVNKHWNNDSEFIVWKKMSTGSGLDPGLTTKPPLKQIKSVYSLLAQYKFILKALSLPDQLFNAFPYGPDFSPAFRPWKIGPCGNWKRNSYYSSNDYVPYYKQLY